MPLCACVNFFFFFGMNAGEKLNKLKWTNKWMNKKTMHCNFCKPWKLGTF